MINVYSETGKLKKVLVHRPGDEFTNLIPSMRHSLLFDDVPFLPIAQKEHDQFTNIMKNKGVDVIYIEELIYETLASNPDLKTKFVTDFLRYFPIKDKNRQLIEKYLISLPDQQTVDKMIAGVPKEELSNKTHNYPFFNDPLPNLIFQRDPVICLGNFVLISSMWSKNRSYESHFYNFVFSHHPELKNTIRVLQKNDKSMNFEGGDFMVLNKKTLIIGSSQRTSLESIHRLSDIILHDTTNSFEKIVVFDIQKDRAYMHLDTVITNIDDGKFLLYADIFKNHNLFNIIEITLNGEKKLNVDLKEYLTKLTNKEVEFIKCGGDSYIQSAIEQWNDGANVLCISPHEVIAYNRNPVTIKLLEKSGITVHQINSSELSRGRGGPRCMTMPLWRD